MANKPIKITDKPVLDKIGPMKCPDCGSKIIEKWSGVKCSSSKCGYWFCY